jgi:hypothetical protein
MILFISNQRSRRAIRPGGIAGKGTSKMTILSALRERLSGPDASAESRSVGDAQRDPVEEARLPFAGYDRLDDREVIGGLSDHSQIELEAVESYERSHESREPVLDKLRWMRGREPLPGYDARGVEEIVAALEEADLATIKKVRAYERKFANRPAVLEAVVRVHHRRVAVRPPSAAPTYQSASATSASRAPVDRPEVDHAERNGRP